MAMEELQIADAKRCNAVVAPGFFEGATNPVAYPQCST